MELSLIGSSQNQDAPSLYQQRMPLTSEENTSHKFMTSLLTKTTTWEASRSNYNVVRRLFNRKVLHSVVKGHRNWVLIFEKHAGIS